MKNISLRYIVFILFIILLACHVKDEDFELCGIGILKPYYVTGLDYHGEIYAIEQAFNKNYVPPTDNNTGIVKIRFQVNCHGDTGNFQYESYNLEYEKMDLNDSIEIQIRKITRGLDEWIPGRNDAGENVNSFKFLSFRLDNGIITEILPK